MNVYIGGTKDYSAMRGPAPEGFHVPTKDEWNNIYTAYTGLGLSGGTNFSTYLKLPLAGMRLHNNLNYSNRGVSGSYWTVDSAASNTAKYVLFDTSNVFIDNNTYRSYGMSIRSFKNTPIIPDNNWTTLYAGTGDAGIFHDTTNGLISISSNGTTWYTIADKNLGATAVYNSGDTLSESNCGKVYQRGNNYGFSGDANYDTSQITQSSTKVDVTGYGPGNYYSSSTWITVNPRQSSANDGYNLRGGVTGIVSPAVLKNAYIGYGWTPTSNTIAYYPLKVNANDFSGNNNNGTNGSETIYTTKDGVQCCYINSLNSRISLPGLGSYNNITISLWFNAGYQTTMANGIFGCRNTGDNRDFGIYGYTTYISVNRWNGTNSDPVQTSSAKCDGNWYNVIAVNGSNGLELYVNGVLSNNSSNVRYFQSDAGQSFIGGVWNNGASSLLYMSEVILENKLWTATEVLNYYNSIKSNYGL